MPRLLSVLSLALALLSPTILADSTFLVPHLDNGQDDSPALLAALPAIANGTYDHVLFQKGATYNILTPLNFGTLNNLVIEIQGNISLPTNVSAVQSIVASSSFPGAWFVLKGSNVTFAGSKDPQWGWVDAHGQQWWDAQNQVNRPHGFKFTVNNFILQDMKLWKPIGWCFALGGNNVQAFNNRIEAGSSTTGFPFNTDGFGVSGTNVYIEGSHIVNGDDCITINNGATNVHVKDSYCKGGHGLSVGSLGSGGSVANVSNILFENAVMVDELYGARFKSWAGGKGAATNITWKNVAFSNVPFPIFVTQNYFDQEVGPPPTTGPNATNTEVIDFRWENFIGTIRDTPYVEGSCVTDPCWYFVPNATGKEVIIWDVSKGTASDLFAKDIFARTETGSPVAVMCDPSTISTDVGFVCRDGKFTPTLAGLGL